MDKISFLIDTNIFIQLEDDQIVKKSFNKFHRLCNENPASIYVHPMLKEEIKEDKDRQRKESSLSKINKYTRLEDPPSANKKQLEKLFGEIKNTNDEVDCQLVYALYKHSVSFLVTEDIGIHQRASKQNIKNKVLTVNQANNMLEKLFPKPIDVSLPQIKIERIYNINQEDDIFNSLRDDYPNFEEWFKTCCEEQVQSWGVVNYSSNNLEAICIYKGAKKDDYTNYSIPKKALKLATFKVSEFYRGKKLGELMLKQAFLYCVKNNFQSCWMTVFPKYKILIDFIKDFGFIEIGKTTRIDKNTKEKELVFMKSFIKPENYPLNGLDFHIKYFPFYDDRKNIGKYIIPIKNKYYEILFPEKKDQMSFDGMGQEIPGNTIKKMYLCHAPTKQLKRNDLLFFYVSSPIQRISSIGIVESTFRSSDLNKVVSYVGKRSVYSFSEIKEMAKKNVLVIAFRFIKHLSTELNLQKLRTQQIIEAPPQSIQRIKKYDQFKTILSLTSKKKLPLS